jgi:hypothetical protein
MYYFVPLFLLSCSCSCSFFYYFFFFFIQFHHRLQNYRLFNEKFHLTLLDISTVKFFTIFTQPTGIRTCNVIYLFYRIRWYQSGIIICFMLVDHE